MLTKDTFWETNEGKRYKLKDLEDTHLANILNFIKNKPCYPDQLTTILLEIAKKRGLTKKFLNRSQIPYKNGNETWEIWDNKRNTFIEIQKIKEK